MLDCQNQGRKNLLTKIDRVSGIARLVPKGSESVSCTIHSRKRLLVLSPQIQYSAIHAIQTDQFSTSSTQNHPKNPLRSLRTFSLPFISSGPVLPRAPSSTNLQSTPQRWKRPTKEAARDATFVKSQEEISSWKSLRFWTKRTNGWTKIPR